MQYPSWWNKTITIFHKRNTKDEHGRTHYKWVRQVVDGCFVTTKSKQSISNNEITPVKVNIVRTPCFVEVVTGDIIVLSETNNSTELTSDVAIKSAYPNSFTVDEIHDNTGDFLPHMYISG